MLSSLSLLSALSFSVTAWLCQLCICLQSAFPMGCQGTISRSCVSGVPGRPLGRARGYHVMAR